MSLKIPVGQKVLSNVAVIKLDKNGKHFEIAVFPNKVSSWRKGLETDINQVIQSNMIFTNVDQGMQAKRSDVLEVLGVETPDEALRYMLDHGKLSLAEKERKIIISNLTKDIASIVASQCVNVNTQRPLTPSTVERVMREIGYSVKISKPAKAQALQVIKTLQNEGYPIERARIRLQFHIKHDLADQMASMLPKVESIDRSGQVNTKIVAQVDPGVLRELAMKLVKEFGEDVAIDILDLYVNPASNIQVNEEATELVYEDDE